MVTFKGTIREQQRMRCDAMRGQRCSSSTVRGGKAGGRFPFSNMQKAAQEHETKRKRQGCLTLVFRLRRRWVRRAGRRYIYMGKGLCSVCDAVLYRGHDRGVVGHDAVQLQMLDTDGWDAGWLRGRGQVGGCGCGGEDVALGFSVMVLHRRNGPRLIHAWCGLGYEGDVPWQRAVCDRMACLDTSLLAANCAQRQLFPAGRAEKLSERGMANAAQQGSASSVLTSTSTTLLFQACFVRAAESHILAQGCLPLACCMRCWARD